VTTQGCRQHGAGIELRRCGLADEQTLIARGLYAEGLALAGIAAEFGSPAGGLRHGMIKLSGFPAAVAIGAATVRALTAISCKLWGSGGRGRWALRACFG
jgi:hypothetical protein